ncbi:MAG: autotransporter domain-containing protein [Pseudomonadota bacterium]
MRCWAKGAAVAAAMVVGVAGARADFIVDNGQTVFTTQILINGQTGIVKPGGRILTGGVGVFAGNSNTITNEGQITTLGAVDVGIFMGNNNVVNNTGTISTSGLGAAFGILGGNGNTIGNAGAISTLGGSAHGVTVANNNTIFNSGAITTQGATAHGINAVNNNTIGNSGTISTTGLGAIGVFAFGTGNTIGNSGTISTLGANAFGISTGANTTVNNSGNIVTQGGAAHGVIVTTGSTITNTGTISASGLTADSIQGATNNVVNNSGQLVASGTASAAVRFTGGGNTLRLLQGSNIQGPLNFAPGNTLDVANGLNINNTFTGNAPFVVANGAPFAVNGLQVAVVDPTALAMADDIVFDLTNSVSGSVFSRLRSERLGGSTGQAVASLDEDDGLGFASSIGAGSATEAWVEVFGLARDQNSTSPTVGANHYLGGVVAGVDTPVGADTRAGLFLGASYGELDVEFDSHDEDIGSAFIGVYGGYASGLWAVDLVVTGGWSRYELSRNIANNAAPGGMETASADYDGYFIAPELSVARTVSVNGQEVIPSVQLGYAGTHLDSYTETGSSSGMTVDDRFIHLLTGRFQVTVPVRIPQYADSVYFAPYAGVEGRTRLDNSNVDAVLLGQTINFDAGGEDSVGAALAGVELSALIDDGVSLFGSVEATLESNSGRTIAGQAGLQIAF